MGWQAGLRVAGRMPGISPQPTIASKRWRAFFLMSTQMPACLRLASILAENVN